MQKNFFLFDQRSYHVLHRFITLRSLITCRLLTEGFHGNLNLEPNVRHNASLSTSETPSTTQVPTTEEQAKGNQSYQSYSERSTFLWHFLLSV